MSAFSTLPGLLEEALLSGRGDRAFHYREKGGWQAVRDPEFHEQVRCLALALKDLGLGRGDCVGIFGQPSPFWLAADFAIQSAGAASVPFYKHFTRRNFKFKLRDTKMKCIFVFGTEYWRALAPFRRKFRHILAHNASTEGGKVTAYADLLRTGAAMAKAHYGMFGDLVDRVKPDDLATIIYTSGSTGKPKGVELTHHNLVSQVHASMQRFPADPSSDRAVSFLPLAHAFERMIMYVHVASAIDVYFVSRIRDLGKLMKEVEPTLMTAVPIMLKGIYDRISADAARSGEGVRGRLLRHAFQRADGADPERDPVTLRDRIFDRLVYSKFRRAMGGRLRCVIVGGAAMPARLTRFFWWIGIPVYQGYGLTEASPVLCTNYPGHNRIGTVGPGFPGVTVALDDHGEVIARGPNVMRGYHRRRRETAAVIDRDGWLHTGDTGQIDGEGFLTITGRSKQLFKTATGKYVSPVPVETELARSRLVNIAMIVGDGRDYVTCLLFLNPKRVRALAQDKGEEPRRLSELLKSAVIRKKVQEVVDDVNDGLNRWEQIRAWRLVPEVPSVESGELTPTLALRRDFVAHKYRHLVESMYRRGPGEPGHSPPDGGLSAEPGGRPAGDTAAPETSVTSRGAPPPAGDGIFSHLWRHRKAGSIMKNRIAVVDGVRTPFCKAWGALREVPADDLGAFAVKELLVRTAWPREQIDEVIFGNVAQPINAANVARVIALKAGLPVSIPAQTVHRNCASGMQAVTAAANKILAGEAEVVLAGGTESMSNIPLIYGRRMTDFFMRFSRSRTLVDRLRALSSFRPSFLKPVIGLEEGLTDPICGMIMGMTAEVLSREFHIAREEQDAFALQSHLRAQRALDAGILAQETVPLPVPPRYEHVQTADQGPRADASMEGLAKLKPYFDRKTGTVTVGNSSQVTDGAVALLITSVEAARKAGVEPLGYLREYTYAALEGSRMGLGPVYATARLLDKMGDVTMQDFELVELNEAFAAQVLACQRAFASEAFARKFLGRETAVGDLDSDRLNVNGGAVALGHPVGATGARLVLTLLKELRRRSLNRGLATLCVGGGQGAALALEVS